MRILFLSDIPVWSIDNNVVNNPHNGSGWIASLVYSLASTTNTECAVAFCGSGRWGERKENITYFPMPVFSSLKSKMQRKISVSMEEKLTLPYLLEAITQFSPDVIHVFGSENALGKVSEHTTIPCIIHIQGFLPSYYNAKFPPCTSRWDYIVKFLLHPMKLYRFCWFDKVFKFRAEREAQIVKNCHNFFGRTEWDKSIVSVYNPNARYFYCSEMLRNVFYQNQGKWQAVERKKKVIVSVLSTPTYKGHDLILKTAQMLKQYRNFDFQWKIFGGMDVAFWENKLGVSADELNVVSCGTVTAEQLKNELLQADLFVHPSYIDNSPNSVCEAQLLGMPVIAANVGGLSSLIDDGRTGFLVPANDPVMFTARIDQIFCDIELSKMLGKNAAATAQKRHEPETVTADCLSAYQKMVDNV